MKSDNYKGYFFAIVATLAYSNVYIFSKAALNVVHLVQFGVYWYAIGSLLNFFWTWKEGKLTLLKSLTKKQIQILVLLGFLEILTNTAFFLSINIIPDPSVTSFLGNLYPVMLTLSGIIFLKERFTRIESFGVIIALAGAFVISYTGRTSLKDLFIPGTGIVFINAILATTASVVIKINVKKLTPELITLNHNVWLLTYSMILLIILGKSLIIPGNVLLNIAIGSALGPFLGILTIYYSFRYIEASRSSIVQSLKGIIVLIGAFLYFGTFPLPHQLLGGLLTVIGVLIMSLAQSGIFGKRRLLKNQTQYPQENY